MQGCSRLEEFAAKQIKACEQEYVVWDEVEVKEAGRKIPPFRGDKRQNMPMGCFFVLNILHSSLCLGMSSTFPHRLHTLPVGQHSSRTILW